MGRNSWSINEVILIWWVANEPILKENKDNQNLVVFNLATRRKWSTKDDQKREEVQYHKIALWWKLAQTLEKLLVKGMKVYIKWYLHNRKLQIWWEESPRIITEIVANDLLILDRRKRNVEDEKIVNDYDNLENEID